MFLLGYDIGSSSVKASLIEAGSGKVVVSSFSPQNEMPIRAERPGWAEQDPQVWWDHLIAATGSLREKAHKQFDQVLAIGISYQMHGLVIVDQSKKVLRPSIIWCDSRAVEIGERAFSALGREVCLERLLNSPGNFTASKLMWVKEMEPKTYQKIYKFMLPGDYIAMKMTGEIQTTASGLSEGILWDFKEGTPSRKLLNYFGISIDLLPQIVDTFSVHGELNKKAAQTLGLRAGVKVSYRAGDQPNNALSLNVLRPGEIAATAGTSGVVYGVTDQMARDWKSRANTFLHVNHSPLSPRYGVLVCVNGTGILNRWLKDQLGAFGRGITYEEMNNLAREAPVGSDGLVILPFGNGAERTLENRDLGASVHGLQFNIHRPAHLIRAVQEGIVNALNYGVAIMRDMGMEAKTIKAGYTNMFLSPLFAEAFASVTLTRLDLYQTDGSQGAARGAGIGCGIYKTLPEAFAGLKAVNTIEPKKDLITAYQKAYQNWLIVLNQQINKNCSAPTPAKSNHL